MATKKVTAYGPMKGILKLNEGSVVEVKKDDEITHEFMSILRDLDGAEVSITIKHIEEAD